MNKIPTAEEFIKNYVRSSDGYSTNEVIDVEDAIEFAIAYAKLRVKAALEAAADNVSTTCLADRFLDAYDSSKDAEGDIFVKDSILNAYPENLIV